LVPIPYLSAASSELLCKRVCPGLRRVGRVCEAHHARWWASQTRPTLRYVDQPEPRPPCTTSRLIPASSAREDGPADRSDSRRGERCGGPKTRPLRVGLVIFTRRGPGIGTAPNR